MAYDLSHKTWNINLNNSVLSVLCLTVCLFVLAKELLLLTTSWLWNVSNVCHGVYQPAPKLLGSQCVHSVMLLGSQSVLCRHLFSYIKSWAHFTDRVSSRLAHSGCGTTDWLTAGCVYNIPCYNPFPSWIMSDSSRTTTYYQYTHSWEMDSS